MQDMPQIAGLEQRLAAALDRIGQGLKTVARPAPPGMPGAVTDQTAALQEALEAERGANAQFAERLKMVKDREAQVRAQLEARVAELTEAAQINTSLQAELEELRTQRQNESAEMQAILAELVPLIEEPARHA